MMTRNKVELERAYKELQRRFDDKCFELEELRKRAVCRTCQDDGNHDYLFCVCCGLDIYD